MMCGTIFNSAAIIIQCHTTSYQVYTCIYFTKEDSCFQNTCVPLSPHQLVEAPIYMYMVELSVMFIHTLKILINPLSSLLPSSLPPSFHEKILQLHPHNSI